MKRYGNLYTRICDKDNICLAIKNASRDHAGDPAVIGIIGWGNSKNLFRKHDGVLEGHLIGAY